MSYLMADIDRPFGMLNIHRCTTCVENLLKEDFDEVGNPREGEGGPDCVSLARQEICRSESGVPVRATRKGLGGREGTGRDPVRQPWCRTIPLQGEWRSEEHTSELQSQSNLVCRLLLEKKNKIIFRALSCSS